MVRKIQSVEGIGRFSDMALVFTEYNKQSDWSTDMVPFYVKSSTQNMDKYRDLAKFFGVLDFTDLALGSAQDASVMVDLRRSSFFFPSRGLDNLKILDTDIYQIKSNSKDSFEEQSDLVIQDHWANFDQQKAYKTLADVDPRNQYLVLMKQFLTPMINGEEKRIELSDFLDGNFAKETLAILRVPHIDQKIAQSYASFIAHVSNEEFKAAVNHQDQLYAMLNL